MAILSVAREFVSGSVNCIPLSTLNAVSSLYAEMNFSVYSPEWVNREVPHVIRLPSGSSFDVNGNM